MLFRTAAFSSLIAFAAAHATFQEMWVNGVDQGSFCVRLPLSNSPVTDITSDDLTCNVTPSSSNGICQVNPGDQVTVEMHQQPNDRSCATQAIGGDHYGPMQVYLAKVDNALTADGPSSSWFKIGEMAMPSMNPDYWGTEVLNDNCGHFTVTIPQGIEPGNYLLRAEVIALHVASSVGGAQFYMSCFQINVGGSGTASPPTVQIPGVYSAQDPGILINIYQSLTTYNIPGPTPYGTPVETIATTAWPTTATWNTAQQPSTVPTAPAGSASATPPPAPTSTATVKTTAAGSPTTVKTTAAGSPTTVKTTVGGGSPTSTASGATQTMYGQCGGNGYTGPTACASGSTCTTQSQYYSQCLPA